MYFQFKLIIFVTCVLNCTFPQPVDHDVMKENVVQKIAPGEKTDKTVLPKSTDVNRISAHLKDKDVFQDYKMDMAYSERRDNLHQSKSIQKAKKLQLSHIQMPVTQYTNIYNKLNHARRESLVRTKRHLSDWAHRRARNKLASSLLAPSLLPMKTVVRTTKPIIEDALDPYHMEEVQQEIGDIMTDTLLQTTPQVAQSIAELSPTILEILKLIPESERLSAFYTLIQKVPTILQESLEHAVQPVQEQLSDLEPSETQKAPNLFHLTENKKAMTPLERLQELKEKIKLRHQQLINPKRKASAARTKLANAKQGDREIEIKYRSALYQSPYSPSVILDNLMYASKNVIPLVNETLREVAHLQNTWEDEDYETLDSDSGIIQSAKNNHIDETDYQEPIEEVPISEDDDTVYL